MDLEIQKAILAVAKASLNLHRRLTVLEGAAFKIDQTSMTMEDLEKNSDEFTDAFNELIETMDNK